METATALRGRNNVMDVGPVELAANSQDLVAHLRVRMLGLVVEVDHAEIARVAIPHEIDPKTKPLRQVLLVDVLRADSITARSAARRSALGALELDVAPPAIESLLSFEATFSRLVKSRLPFVRKNMVNSFGGRRKNEQNLVA